MTYALVAGIYGAFCLLLAGLVGVVWLWERVSGRAFDPVVGMDEQAREIRELPEFEPRRRLA